MADQIKRDWWMRRVEDAIAPFVTARGYDSEVQIDEPGRDLWTINGIAPPPFRSIAEKKWLKENRARPYTEDDKMPAPPPGLATEAVVPPSEGKQMSIGREISK